MRLSVLCLLLCLATTVRTQAFDTCKTAGPAMLMLQEGVNEATIAAARSGAFAQTLSGTNPSKNHAYRDIEDQTAHVSEGRAKGFNGLGSLLGMNFQNSSVDAATKAITDEAKAELEMDGIFANISLGYERLLNHTNKRTSPWLYVGAALVSPALAAGMAAGASGQQRSTSTSTSTTQGTIYGNQLNATTQTTTTTYQPSAASIAGALAQAQAQADTAARMQMIILTYQPQVENEVYTLNPLIQKWIGVCRSAGELPESSGT